MGISFEKILVFLCVLPKSCFPMPCQNDDAGWCLVVMFQQPSLRVFQNPPTRTWSFKDPRVGYAGAALMLILSFLTSSRAANNLVEDGTKIMDAKKSQISTSSANRMVRISKGCSQKTRVGGGWMLLGPWSLGWNCETVIYLCQVHYNLVLYSLAIHIFLTAFHLSYCMNCVDLTWPATNSQITPWFHLRCIHFWEVISVATPKSLLHLLSIPRLVWFLAPQKQTQGLLDFYGACCLSTSSWFLTLFGSFALSFCSSIWFTTGYYGAMGCTRAGQWKQGSYRVDVRGQIWICVQ